MPKDCMFVTFFDEPILNPVEFLIGLYVFVTYTWYCFWSLYAALSSMRYLKTIHAYYLNIL